MAKHTIHLRYHVKPDPANKGEATREEVLEAIDGALGVLDLRPGVRMFGDFEEAQPDARAFMAELRQHEADCEACSTYVAHVREALGFAQ